jgi:hypothetical protein
MGYNSNGMSDGTKIAVTAMIVVAFFILIILGFAGIPIYSVWQQRLAGEAELKRAEGNRQIKIQEAIALEESAKHYAQAEITKASGVAKANEIIGSSLKDNEAYLRWLWIEGTKENQGKTVIYIPTEGNLPILEAARLNKEAKK